MFGLLASTTSAQETQPNAADLYRRAITEIDSALRLNTDQPVDWPLASEPNGDNYSNAPWPELFEKTAVARSLFTQATSIKRCAFSSEHAVDQYQSINLITRFVVGHAMHVLDKQPSESLAAAVALLAYSDHLEAQSNLFPSIFAVNHAEQGLRLFEAALDRHKANTIGQRDLRRVLAALESRQRTRATPSDPADQSIADARRLLKASIDEAATNTKALAEARGRALELVAEVVKPLQTAKLGDIEKVRTETNKSIKEIKAKYGKKRMQAMLESGTGEALAAVLATMVMPNPVGLLTIWEEHGEQLAKTEDLLRKQLSEQPKSAPQDLIRWPLMVDGHQREALLDLPTAKPDARLHPVVFVFHSHGGRAEGIARAMPIRAHWPEAIVVYPQGLPTPGLFDLEGKGTGWQHKGGDEADRDLRFFDAMLAALQREHRADPLRIHATGHSNGGGFCYVLMVERGHLLASAAPSSASKTQHVGDAELPRIPLLHCGSPSDRVIPWRRQMEAIERLRETRQLQRGVVMEQFPAATEYRSPAGDHVCVYEHKRGHGIPRRQAALTAAFFRATPMRVPPPPPRPLQVTLDSVQRVWDQAPHQAFTDLCIADNQFLLTFREGDGHVYGTNGKVRVLRSRDGIDWTSAAVLEQDGVDLRDPKISLAPTGELVVLMGGSRYADKKFLGRTSKIAWLRTDFGAKAKVVDVTIDADLQQPDDWLWRICWHQGDAYGILYQPKTAGLHLVRSNDATTFDLVKTLDHDGKPSEATVRATPDGKLVALLRRDGGNRNARIGLAAPPFSDWTWKELPTPLGGPELLVLPDGRMLAAGHGPPARCPLHCTLLVRVLVRTLVRG